MIKELIKYKQFIISSIINELKSSFSASKLKWAWAIFKPLSQVLIYAVIFSQIMHAKLPGVDYKHGYVVYLLSGMLAWNLFNEIVTQNVNLFLHNANILKKINFPRIVLPIISAGSGVLNNFLLFISMILIFFIFGYSFSITILWVFLLTGLVVILASGIGLILGILNVFIRDIGHIMSIVLPVWFWLTPIVYPESIVPEKYLFIIKMNPMYYIVHSYHNVIAYKANIDLHHLDVLLLLSLFLALCSIILFKKSKQELVDML